MKLILFFVLVSRISLLLAGEDSAANRPSRECRGDCVGGLFSLVCAHVDDDARCPGAATCCDVDPRKELTTTQPVDKEHTKKPKVDLHTTTYEGPTFKCPGHCSAVLYDTFVMPCRHGLDRNGYCPGGSYCCNKKPREDIATKRPHNRMEPLLTKEQENQIITTYKAARSSFSPIGRD